MEDEDAYARRIWQEMEKRRRQQTDGAAAARNHFAAQREAETLRQQAEFDAAQRSRQILEEEKAKDRAWREAVLKVRATTTKTKVLPSGAEFPISMMSMMGHRTGSVSWQHAVGSACRGDWLRVMLYAS